MEKLVSIVILNYNKMDLTIKLLESLKGTTYKNYEILLVDNSETTECIEYVKEHFPYVKTFPQEKNLGYTGGMNVGIKNSNGDYIVLLNNDVEVHPDWLLELVNSIEADERIGITSSIAIMENGIIQKLGAIELNPVVLKFKSVGEGKIADHLYQKTIDVDIATGSCWMVKREVFNKIGLLDERFFIEWDEVDFCYRARKAGYRVIANPRSKIWHAVSASINKKSYIANFHHRKNRIAFILKNMGLFKKLVNVPITILFLIFLIFSDSLKGDYNSSIACKDAILWNLINFKRLVKGSYSKDNYLL